MRKSTKVIGTVGFILFIAVVLFAVLGPFIIPYDAYKQSGPSFLAPNSDHFLGTNDMGQDILAELAEGARTSLTIGILTALFATLIGGSVGILAGYIGGWFEVIVMRVIDVVLTLPFLPLMIVIAVYMGPGIFTQVFVITLVMWAGKARQIRAQTLFIKTTGPVLAARTMGANHWYIFNKHIFPSVFPLFIPQFVGAVNTAILLESSLSFLGMGNPLVKSWGSILYYANSRSAFLTEAWVWWIIPPGICIVLVVLAFSLMGYFLEEKVNPRLSSYAVTPKRQKQEIVEDLTLVERDIMLSVQNLTVEYPKKGSYQEVVSNVSFEIQRGDVLGIVGESGSGKSTVAASIIQQLKLPGRSKGSIYFEGQALETLDDEQIRQLRGRDIGYIAQAAMNALNPVITIEKQLKEAIKVHKKLDESSMDQRVIEVMTQVGLDTKWRFSFSHELSGGMRQRVIIAMALINRPKLIIADEPTTGLDVIVQVEIVQLLRKLQRELNISMIFISHDLPAVLSVTDQIIIMKYGHIVDRGESIEVAENSSHPYTRRLVDSIPLLKPKKERETVLIS
ncbi:ABC-type dipeptide/oligopeptide/nickel transport system, ATPase component [Psychrobacillus psychrotolerans]|uniref:ABC-type dipeptide/oligopeptide/nickel transport system, ATPase component n=1 Tax=Psychrobacillus psychrotolerans TaxID=126156 RepID=A0A1I5Y3S6_9BACI|nr:dipeptide/oligopeptide/nickel ABC transporter permease/ATP-binding protein [Psychrobacillus psychrotolerans]SFQ38892.1 ABC-type dipeptide/oligopeptide/nickel transport system, ATPase component [Psychrobacillus psychrotolerans]